MRHRIRSAVLVVVVLAVQLLDGAAGFSTAPFRALAVPSRDPGVSMWPPGTSVVLRWPARKARARAGRLGRVMCGARSMASDASMADEVRTAFAAGVVQLNQKEDMSIALADFITKTTDAFATGMRSRLCPAQRSTRNHAHVRNRPDRIAAPNQLSGARLEPHFRRPCAGRPRPPRPPPCSHLPM
jgi:hypothetical protein